MGRMTEDELIVTNDQENSNPMSDDSKSVKKDKKKDKSKSKKANSIFKLPSFRKN